MTPSVDFYVLWTYATHHLQHMHFTQLFHFECQNLHIVLIYCYKSKIGNLIETSTGFYMGSVANFTMHHEKWKTNNSLSSPILRTVSISLAFWLLKNYSLQNLPPTLPEFLNIMLENAFFCNVHALDSDPMDSFSNVDTFYALFVCVFIWVFNLLLKSLISNRVSRETHLQNLKITPNQMTHKEIFLLVSTLFPSINTGIYTLCTHR